MWCFPNSEGNRVVRACTSPALCDCCVHQSVCPIQGLVSLSSHWEGRTERLLRFPFAPFILQCYRSQAIALTLETCQTGLVYLISSGVGEQPGRKGDRLQRLHVLPL